MRFFCVILIFITYHCRKGGFFHFQINSKNRIKLLEDPHEEAVHRTANKLGLAPVGWIFTDLVADDLTKGTVKNFRGNIVSTTKRQKPLDTVLIKLIKQNKMLRKYFKLFCYKYILFEGLMTIYVRKLSKF